jgi:hypothetical protein
VLFGDEMLDIRAGGEPLLGAALDLGTTSLALNVFNLETGEPVGRSSALNPQTALGATSSLASTIAVGLRKGFRSCPQQRSGSLGPCWTGPWGRSTDVTKYTS